MFETHAYRDALNDCLSDFRLVECGLLPVGLYGASSLWERAPHLGGGLVESWLTAAEFWSEQGVPFHLVFVLDDDEAPSP